MIETATYGTFTRVGPFYVIDAAPHVRMLLRRVFLSADRGGAKNLIQVSDTLQNAETLRWFLQRYPLEGRGDAAEYMEARADASLKLKADCREVMAAGGARFEVGTILPLRDYQTQAVELLMRRHRMLCGDDLGLGKTAVALGAMANGAVPAVIVCQTHLQRQWVAEARKFLRGCVPHIVKKGSPYRLPAHNLLVIPYSKLRGWKDALEGYAMIVFDEAQELRREGTSKYSAAKMIAGNCRMSLGLTATPVYNYGDEIFNVIDALDPGALGDRWEFLREWCVPYRMHHRVVDPVALGSYLADSHLFLRRRRKDVGRELPPVTRVGQTIDHDPKRLAAAKASALQLARAVLEGGFEERGRAARDLDRLMRQQTGIAKAPFVAAFVGDMVKSGEPVVLCGWHREVYDVWAAVFKGLEIRTVLYTGTESPAQKQKAVEDFVEGRADVFMMSLRSGAGLNRLQERSQVIAFGELDWSPQVHEQCIGRLQRDGQAGNVTAVYLVSEGGSDPVIAATLGLKREQSEGIINPATADSPIGPQVEISRAGELAREILKKHAK